MIFREKETISFFHLMLVHQAPSGDTSEDLRDSTSSSSSSPTNSSQPSFLYLNVMLGTTAHSITIVTYRVYHGFGHNRNTSSKLFVVRTLLITFEGIFMGQRPDKNTMSKSMTHSVCGTLLRQVKQDMN